MTAPDAGLWGRLTEALCHEYHPMHWDVAYGNRNKPCGACRIHAAALAPLVADEIAAAEVRALREAAPEMRCAQDFQRLTNRANRLAAHTDGPA